MLHTTVPTDVERLDLRISLATAPGQPSRTLYLDGAVLTAGSMPTGTVPRFDNAQLTIGEWGGQRFANLVRNGSAETAWPHLQSWVDQLLVTYARRSAAQTLSALFDIQRTGWDVWLAGSVRIVPLFFGSFGWGHLTLDTTFWRPIYLLLTTGMLVGCVRWLWTARR
jgi:hypothetical protein